MNRRTGAVNIPIALASLALAIILWMIIYPIRSVRTTQRFEVPLDPIQFDDQDRGKYVLRDPPNTVTLFAKVSEDEAKDFRSRFHATVGLSSPKPGTNKYRISVYPREFERLVQENSNPVVSLTIDQFQKLEKIPIIAETSGKLSDPSLVVNEMTVDPKTVTIAGPEPIVSRVKTVHATLPLEKVLPLSPAPMVVTLEAFDANNEIVPATTGLEIVPSSATLTPKLSQTPSTKSIFVEAKFTGQVPDGYAVKGFSISPNPVVASGSSMALNKVTNVGTQLIDVSQLTSSQVLTVQLVVPRDVKLNISEVRVSLRIEPISVKSLNPPSSSPKTPVNSTTGTGKAR